MSTTLETLLVTGEVSLTPTQVAERFEQLVYSGELARIAAKNPEASEAEHELARKSVLQMNELCAQMTDAMRRIVAAGEVFARQRAGASHG